ncbi:hypothetical protein HYW46_00405 [Candidatus Daviesbacteria bacterium]|nr:hypothetical protein [Candidatus Daviesbacteria bacterium]
MKSSKVRQKYFDFFTKKGHKLTPSSSIIPSDPTTLFTSAGMQPMIPYLLGEAHPQGKRIVNSQKCFRSQDIMEVGDNRHTTFFEMLGNWSFGDYFKKEQLGWVFEFLTKDLGLDPNKLYVTAFEGNGQIPKDRETVEIWQELFKTAGIEAKLNERIFLYGAAKNWWTRADSPESMPEGEPGGPDSEVFYLFDQITHDPKFGKKCHPNCDCGRFLEIANSVFMQYQKKDKGFIELPQKNVDFGGGLERLVAACQNQPDIFKIDLFWPIIEKLKEDLRVEYGDGQNSTASLRVIADHIKAATFLIKDGVTPSNKMQGYVLRRLLRRCAVKIHALPQGRPARSADGSLNDSRAWEANDILPKLVDPIIDIYQETDYFQTGDWDQIRQTIAEELIKFKQTLKRGLRQIKKIDKVTGKNAFDLYQSYGFPFELIEELFLEKGQKVSREEFDKEFKKHQELSHQGSFL